MPELAQLLKMRVELASIRQVAHHAILVYSMGQIGMTLVVFYGA
jgi:hypothetical protein